MFILFEMFMSCHIAIYVKDEYISYKMNIYYKAYESAMQHFSKPSINC